MARDSVTSIAASTRNTGTAKACLDIGQVQSRARSVEDWKSRVNAKDNEIKNLKIVCVGFALCWMW